MKNIGKLQWRFLERKIRKGKTNVTHNNSLYSDDQSPYKKQK